MKIFLIAILLMLAGCNTANIKESILGFETKPYIEPNSESIAYLIVDAPKLKKKLLVEDKINISFYNSCTDSKGFRNEGYIGGFELSSKPKIGKTKKVKIDANSPLFVEVGYSETGLKCTNKFRLLPEPNATYKILWEYEWGTCSAGGMKMIDNEKYAKSEEIVQQNNKGTFWAGPSGRTTSEWRGCSK